jgi:drug/metabolite transporter (DMT)-like permease
VVSPQPDARALTGLRRLSAEAALSRPRPLWWLSPPLLMVAASFLFATMGVCVKLASSHYASSEIVMYRGGIGLLMMAAWSRWRGQDLRTTVPGMHLWRGIVGVSSLCLWFYALGGLPVATAMTLNYMSSVWMALFLIGGAVVVGGARVDARLIATVLSGFVGVALILQPTLVRDQLWHGLMGLMSGVLSAMAYLQVTALGRAGEPESRIVFYFSCGGLLAGAALTLLGTGFHGHTGPGVALLLAVGVLATTAQMMMTRAYGTGKPLVNASLQYLGIAFAFGWGVLLFDDAVTVAGVGGTLLVIGAGIAAALLRQRRQPARDSQLPDIEP